jgi:hypothetical protein
MLSFPSVAVHILSSNAWQLWLVEAVTFKVGHVIVVIWNLSPLTNRFRNIVGRGYSFSGCLTALSRYRIDELVATKKAS